MAGAYYLSEEPPIFSYQRDRFVPTEELVFPFLDDISGTIRGYRIFTACRTVNRRIFRLEDHLDRLYRSAAGIYMKPPCGKEELRELLDELVDKNLELDPDSDLLIEIIFSGGLAGDTMKQSSRGAHLYIATQPLLPHPEEYYRTGVALATFPHQRMLPDVKLLNYVGAIVGHQTVVPQHDAYEVVFVDPADGKTILEGSTFTMFFCDRDGIIYTPPLDGRILDSITRRVILEIAEKTGSITIQETDITTDDLTRLPEAFMASTTRGILPVSRIDTTVLGDGTPGRLTREMMTILADYMNSY